MFSDRGVLKEGSLFVHSAILCRLSKETWAHMQHLGDLLCRRLGQIANVQILLCDLRAELLNWVFSGVAFAELLSRRDQRQDC